VAVDSDWYKHDGGLYSVGCRSIVQNVDTHSQQAASAAGTQAWFARRLVVIW